MYQKRIVCSKTKHEQIIWLWKFQYDEQQNWRIDFYETGETALAFDLFRSCLVIHVFLCQNFQIQLFV